MESIIFIKEKINLPKFDELVSFMWEKGISLSYVRTGDDFYDSNIVELAWNKWVDNPEWSGSGYTHEYIDFEIMIMNVKNFPEEITMLLSQCAKVLYYIKVEVSDSALLIDKRAYLRAIYLIAKSCNGYILEKNSKSLLISDEFYEKYKDIIEMPFTKEFKIVY